MLISSEKENRRNGMEHLNGLGVTSFLTGGLGAVCLRVCTVHE